MLKKLRNFLMELRDYYITGVFRILKRLDKINKKLNHQDELLNALKHSQNALSQSLDAQSKRQALYHTATQYLGKNLKKDIRKDTFLLFHTFNHNTLYDAYNLGDYMQTIATKRALNELFKDLKFEYFDRDILSFYQSSSQAKTPCVMQGWFSIGYDFMPSVDILPIFIGTHLTQAIHHFFIDFLVHYPNYFEDLEIGCRDKYTLEFCQNYKIKSYFSRCLTLTLPKRKPLKTPGKVFFVNVPKPFMDFIPQDLKQNAEFVSHGLRLAPKTHWQHYNEVMQALLERYKNEAALIITSRLHCAAPCTALGIPVIFMRHNNEQSTRFSALDGILKIHTLEDFKEGRVDFSPKAPNIEPLKEAMLENIKLSILKAFNENVDEARLKTLRELIANFNVLE